MKRKHVFWGISLLPLLLTAAAIQFLPDRVPMHFSAGVIDRYGSRYEDLVFPGLILLFSLFWQWLMNYYEKRAARAPEEKQRLETENNLQVLWAAALGSNILFLLLQLVILLSQFKTTGQATVSAPVMVEKLVLVGCGILTAALGNLCPRTRRNSMVGIRTGWSAYNDVTWAKSNRFGGYGLILTGLLTVLAALLLPTATAGLVMLGLLLLLAIACLLYSHRVFLQEKQKDAAPPDL